MNPRWRILSLICFGVALLCLVVVRGSFAEPRYQGYSLTHWLLVYRLNEITNPVAHQAAAEAVRQIGTNALPFLVEWARYDEPAWRTRAYRQTWKIKSNPWQRRWISKLAQPLCPCRPGRPDALARIGFQILGPAAEPALPELIGLALDPHAKCRASSIIYCAAQIGPASFSPLTNILANSSSPASVRCAIVDQIISGREFALAATPTLVRASRDSDLSVAAAASRALRTIGALEPDRVTLSTE